MIGPTGDVIIAMGLFLTVGILPLPPIKAQLIPSESWAFIAQVSAADFYKRGLNKAKRKDWKGAIADYTQALRINPNDSSIYFSRALARQSIRDCQGAISDFTQAIKFGFIDVLTACNYLIRDSVRFELGNYQGAIEDYTQVIRLDPTSAQAYSKRAIARSRIGDRTGATADHQKAARLSRKKEYKVSNLGADLGNVNCLLLLPYAK